MSLQAGFGACDEVVLEALLEVDEVGAEPADTHDKIAVGLGVLLVSQIAVAQDLQYKLRNKVNGGEKPAVVVVPKEPLRSVTLSLARADGKTHTINKRNLLFRLKRATLFLNENAVTNDDLNCRYPSIKGFRRSVRAGSSRCQLELWHNPAQR